MNTRPFLIVLGVSLGLLILGSLAGGVLQSASKLTTEQIGPTWVRVIKLSCMTLFGVIGFSLVPVALNGFIAMQTRIGNGELAVISWLSAHLRQVVYTVWGLLALGLGLALPAAIRDGFLR